MNKTKVLILHTSVGYGIKATAYNIFEILEKSENYLPRVADIGEVEKGKFGVMLEKVYSKVLDRFSGLWGFLYSSKLVNFMILPLRKPIARFQSKNMLKLLREFQPAMVISTQAVCTGVIAYLKSKGLYRGRLVAVFSDYHLHPFWCFKEVDLYICNITEQAEKLKRMGVPAEKIAITGLFIAEKFYKSLDRLQACQEMGLLTTMPKVFLFSGGKPRMSNVEIFKQLLRSNKSFEIVAVCGKNEELKVALEAISAPSMHPVKIIGYSNQIDTIMSASDVLVGKTGGPTMGEAIVKKLPMVLTDIRPGHEEENLKFLLKNNVVDYGRIPREVVFLVEEILDGRRKKSWEKSYEKVVRPTGSVDVLTALDSVRPKASVKHYQSSDI